MIVIIIQYTVLRKSEKAFCFPILYTMHPFDRHEPHSVFEKNLFDQSFLWRPILLIHFSRSSSQQQNYVWNLITLFFLWLQILPPSHTQIISRWPLTCIYCLGMDWLPMSSQYIAYILKNTAYFIRSYSFHD